MTSGDHQPVLVDRVVDLLLGNDGTVFVDCTVGGGGHILRLLEKAERQLRVFGLDRDAEALSIAASRVGKQKDVVFEQGDFKDIDLISRSWNVAEFDGILADFGQSTYQLDDPLRGFSHRFDGPLDMRYNVGQDVSASEIINSASYNELVAIIGGIGQERNAPRIAKMIIRKRPIQRTTELVEVVRKTCSAKYMEKSLARVFMAFRVAVNDELKAIEILLKKSMEILSKGGRMVFLSYDSHQDRLVKRFFKSQIETCTCPPGLPVCLCGEEPRIELLTKGAVRPDEVEISKNPRSRSARLRAAQKL